MKKTFKHFLALIFLVMICFSQQVNAQLSDAEKKERCQNNKNRLAELEKQSAIANAELRKIPEKKEIENARDHMILVTKMSKGKIPTEKKELWRIARLYNFDFQNCFRECYISLILIIEQKIRKGEASLLQKPELLRQKSDLEKQIAVHRNNLIALGCDSRESTENSGLNVSARWDFVCCGGAYKGKLTLIQDGDKISGYFGETTNGTSGEISGLISGTSLEFERRWDGKKQDYHLTLSSDGKTLTGNFGGDRNTSVGTDVIATRK